MQILLFEISWSVIEYNKAISEFERVLIIHAGFGIRAKASLRKAGNWYLSQHQWFYSCIQDEPFGWLPLKYKMYQVEAEFLLLWLCGGETDLPHSQIGQTTTFALARAWSSDPVLEAAAPTWHTPCSSSECPWEHNAQHLRKFLSALPVRSLFSHTDRGLSSLVMSIKAIY